MIFNVHEHNQGFRQFTFHGVHFNHNSQNSVSVRHDSWTPVIVGSMSCVYLNLFFFLPLLIKNYLNLFHWCGLIGSLTTLNNVQLVIFSLYNSIFQEPMSHGYLYACGLFLTTFCSAFINSQFNYWVRKIFFNFSQAVLSNEIMLIHNILLLYIFFQVNKIGLKIRAAVITTVYDKSLSVSLTTLSKFSSGEVWSLP